jgi:hypothetical protein
MSIPGARYAFQVVRPAAPVLRVRYREGVSVDPLGFPDWIPYARAVVQLPPSSPDLGIDEARVVDVVTANETMLRTGDPLWPDRSTPDGWTWAHLPRDRQAALVPVDLHGLFRHVGGVSTGNADRDRRGLPDADGSPPVFTYTERLAPETLAVVEGHLGPLPAGYRAFLARTNGGRPREPCVHPRYGFILDQPFFGLARTDRMQDLLYANGYLTDRLTGDFLAVGYVQGGLLAVRIRGGDEGSVWYWDDDDPRDTDEYTAAEVCARLLHRCADDFDAFLPALREVPATLRELAAANAAGGHATPIRPEGMGAHLPAAMQAPA